MLLLVLLLGASARKCTRKPHTHQSARKRSLIIFDDIPVVKESDNWECSCPIEDFMNSKGITLDKAKYYAIGAGCVLVLMIAAIITLASCLCCTCRKLKRKKAKVSNLNTDYENEVGYSKFLEYQRRYTTGIQNPYTTTPRQDPVPTYPPQ